MAMQSHPVGVYHDFQGLASLKHQAREDQSGSLAQVSKQFESMFVQMMVKQMRQASFGGGLMDSDKTRFYQEMYDKQLSLHLSQHGGIGIAKLINDRLGAAGEREEISLKGLEPYRSNPVQPASRYLTLEDIEVSEAASPSLESSVDAQDTSTIDSPTTFVHSLWPAASDAAASLGLLPEALLAQAALETGWGRHVMPAADGASSHNLFGIKADRRWEGDQVKRETLEYESGMAVRKREQFRAYPSYVESFQDYVEFLRSNPRYDQALANTHDSRAYFTALQDAGYATDPAYAEKILRVMQGSEMRAALEQLKDVEVEPI